MHKTNYAYNDYNHTMPGQFTRELKSTRQRNQLIIIIMLAYLCCAAYTRMAINESSPPCKQRCITFNDDGQRDVGSTRVTRATLHLHVQAATKYTPHHRLGIITPDLLSVPIYRP